jgi:hypothetical protein
LMVKTMVSCKFSLKPIQWLWDLVQLPVELPEKSTRFMRHPFATFFLRCGPAPHHSRSGSSGSAGAREAVRNFLGNWDVNLWDFSIFFYCSNRLINNICQPFFIR